MSAPSGYFLVGPTAVGKSAVAHWIARNRGFDVLSADSMQVYKGMDIGTDKPSSAARSEVAYHGVDLVTPDNLFNVSQYRQYAEKVLRNAAAKGRQIIVTGGSGLYIKSLSDGLAPLPAPDQLMRKHWTDLLDGQGVEALQKELIRTNPALYEELPDKKNARRLIRALEMAGSGKPKTWRRPGAGVPVTGLTMSPADLQSRIEARVERMYSSGLLDEARLLIECCPGLSDTARQAIGYAEAIDCLQGRCSKEEAISRTMIRTRQLAKKQRTWFRHQMNVRWIEIAGREDVAETAARIIKQWEDDGPIRIAE